MSKNRSILIIPVVIILLSRCSGSETYRGNWYATDEEGNQAELIFGENDFSVIEDGSTKIFEYSQYSINISNSVETYGINTGDGRSFKIHFPIADDETKGAILDANDRPLYIISRTGYIGYDEVYDL